MGELQIFQSGQVYKIGGENVKTITNKNIGDRWYVIVQSNRMNNRRDRLILALLTGSENKKNSYPLRVLFLQKN